MRQRTSAALRRSYTRLAPCYDLVAGPAFRRARRRSLAALPPEAGSVLLDGVGTGLDLEWLPRGPRYVGLDLVPAMLARAIARAGALAFLPVQGDAQALPFADGAFDHAVLHLILAVVPQPERALAEAARVVRRGGSLLVLDKFLRPGQRAPLRRLASPLAARVATRLDVVFEELLEAVPPLRVVHDEPAGARGWFRIIRLERL